MEGGGGWGSSWEGLGFAHAPVFHFVISPTAVGVCFVVSFAHIPVGESCDQLSEVLGDGVGEGERGDWFLCVTFFGTHDVVGVVAAAELEEGHSE